MKKNKYQKKKPDPLETIAKHVEQEIAKDPNFKKMYIEEIQKLRKEYNRRTYRMKCNTCKSKKHCKVYKYFSKTRDNIRFCNSYKKRNKRRIKTCLL